MPRLRLPRLLAIAAAAATLAACGGDGDATDQTEEPRDAVTRTEEPTRTPREPSGAATAATGEEIFRSNCSQCHTLAAANASGTVGPDLDELQPSPQQVRQQVRQGGGGMPSFADLLSDDEIQAVAEYVAETSGN